MYLQRMAAGTVIEVQARAALHRGDIGHARLRVLQRSAFLGADAASEQPCGDDEALDHRVFLKSCVVTRSGTGLVFS